MTDDEATAFYDFGEHWKGVTSRVVTAFGQYPPSELADGLPEEWFRERGRNIGKMSMRLIKSALVRGGVQLGSEWDGIGEIPPDTIIPRVVRKPIMRKAMLLERVESLKNRIAVAEASVESTARKHAEEMRGKTARAKKLREELAATKVELEAL